MKKCIPWLAGLLCGQVLAAPPQVVLNAAPSRLDRKLHGRFLHITDIHPDPYYAKGTSQSSQCHRKESGKDRQAGYYGTPFGICDSPWTLTNFTFEHLEEHWSSEIDFVIWTGDNARHDEDHEIPRPLDEILAVNRAIAKKMEDVFLRKGIPVVSSLGNNDVWPHASGFYLNNPFVFLTFTTTEYFISSIWDAFIPSASKTSFRKGAYYAIEVIPDALAAISLSTMYFYHDNKELTAVRGCPVGDASDPGNLQFDWLEEQLEMFRARQMQVWVTGHIPPSDYYYYPECYYRYTELSLRYQDVILGSLFGHLNADHFYFVEAADLNVNPEENRMPSHSFEGTIFEALMTDFEALAKRSKHLNYDDYAIVSVSPSLVPNPYLPSFRVFSYNISGLGSTTLGAVGEDEYLLMTKKDRASRWKHLPYRHGNDGNQCMDAGYRDSWRCKLRPWRSDNHAPSRQNTLWTPLGYAQYYIPRLEEYDKKDEPEFKLEYLTFPISNLCITDGPVPLRNLPKSLREAGVTKSELAPYGLHDLTIPSWLDLACKLGKPREKKLRKQFKKYMYMGGEDI
ncbi:Metallo-dependent phosphatase-like protein [Suillus subaureus]|uniref:Metallo-dependent phosphatase-like protein n=1 Tax=Suillus subaureus TaxID=48587 RepID=A0A9P7JG20_9AGAM|nr:Metallo-dependent phosphatase-like protein [Suillus subaureus]KAG1820175.1 Metallo-dependent phosphatase-like protein [Suillus subaureus]